MAQDNQSSELTGESLTADGILDLLNEDDTDTSIKEDVKDEDKDSKKEDKQDDKDEEKDEEKEDEEIKLVESEDDDTEGSEATDEFIVPARKKDILAKYPKVFKDFPFLETAYYKSQQYSEILPTVEDARIAVQKAESLDNFEKDILNGDLEKLFATVKSVEPKIFRKIADNLLNTIGKVDEGVQFHIVGNVLKHALSRAAYEGKRSKNADLEAAAKIINEFVFQTDEISQPTNLAQPVEDTTESDKLKAEREQFETDRFNTVLGTLQNKIDNTIKSTIDANIDPKDTMSAYVKRNAIRDAFEQLEKAIAKDESFKRTLDSMWKSSKEAKYSTPSVDRIKSAYLSKARTLLPSVIRAARNDALKGSGKQDTSDRNRKGPITAHRSSNSSQNTGNKTPEIQKGQSIKDYLMAD